MGLLNIISMGYTILEEAIVSTDIYECKALVRRGRVEPHVVLLHGYAFTSEVWRGIGLLNALADEDIPFVAVDMPYGRSSKCSRKSRSLESNLAVLDKAVEMFAVHPPLLVGASLGGYVALHYAVRRPTTGLVLIGPVKVFEEELVSRYSSMGVPVLIIYGSRDRVVSYSAVERLRNMIPFSRLIVYRGAGHPAYLDNPSRFISDLLRFHEEVRQKYTS